MPDGCGKACSTSQTTRPPRSLISAPQTACRMTSTLSMPASRPPASIQSRSLKSKSKSKLHTHTLGPPPPPTVSSAVVHKALRKINPRKAAGPDNIPGQALRACATELADVLTSIFNLSLSQSTVPTCFKTTTIVSLPKKSPPNCLNDYRPVALTPVITKCFERVVLAHIQSSMPDTSTPCSIHTGPTGPPQTPLLLPSIFPSLTWKVRTPTSGGSLSTTVPPSTRSSPINSPTNCLHLDYTPHSATAPRLLDWQTAVCQDWK